jgi:hypothetical protein
VTTEPSAVPYFHEAIDVIAAHAPNLADVLERAELEGWSHDRHSLRGGYLAVKRRTQAQASKLILRETRPRTQMRTDPV